MDELKYVIEAFTVAVDLVVRCVFALVLTICLLATYGAAIGAFFGGMVYAFRWITGI